MKLERQQLTEQLQTTQSTWEQTEEQLKSRCGHLEARVDELSQQNSMLHEEAEKVSLCVVFLLANAMCRCMWYMCVHVSCSCMYMCVCVFPLSIRFHIHVVVGKDPDTPAPVGRECGFRND